MPLVAVFDEDQEEEAAQLLHWLGGEPSCAQLRPRGIAFKNQKTLGGFLRVGISKLVEILWTCRPCFQPSEPA